MRKELIMAGQAFGVVGLEVMGRNVAQNIERNGFSVAVFNRTYSKTEDFMNGPAKGKNFKAGKTIEEFVKLLERPRRILLMVKAGWATDATIQSIRPFLEPGDILIDGGNSLYSDTERRAKELESSGIKFFGMGVSGGEEGALWGPSIMPGGDRDAYEHLKPVLEKIAAKAPQDGKPCVTYCGAGSAGHFVKMVHNGIEYGDMQLICEAFDVMRRLLGMSPAAMHDVFARWNTGPLDSYLIEITRDILGFTDPESGKPMIDLILDTAGQKGTGKWTVITACDLGVPLTLIAEAVFARTLSSQKDERVAASRVLKSHQVPFTGNHQAMVDDLEQALYASKIISYAQGFSL